ncbi:EAP30/Vps36 family-domain-containing protein [Paraphysoderma sedebokerense]|nr:EAP30/Vps36 family-domain-containing protein [Paraphysoderma sedebokerense]
MLHFQPAQLTSTNRPVLLSGVDETIQVTQDGVGLYDGETRLTTHESGTCYLTTHRLVWVDSSFTLSKQNGISLELKYITGVESYAGFLRSSAKLRIHISTSAPTSASSALISSPPLNSVSSDPSAALFSPSANSTSSTWICHICSHENNSAVMNPSTSPIIKCQLCGVKKLESATTPPQSLAAASKPQQNQITCPICTYLNNSLRTNCDMCSSRLTQTPNGVVNQTRQDIANDSVKYIKLSFRGGGMSAVHAVLKTLLEKKPWEAEPSRVLSPSSNSGPLIGGISGIIKTRDETKRETEDTIDTAFQDLDALMEKAGEMVKLAESISAKLSTSNISSTSGGPDNGEEETEETKEFKSYLLSLGIASPVTRSSAGNVYHRELSKQLAEFLEKVLDRHGGVMSLADIYCMFNRARGTALISPSDLITCINLFQSLSLPYTLYTFPTTKFKAILSPRFSDTQFMSRLINYLVPSSSASEKIKPTIQNSKFITILDLSKYENTSTSIAEELLKMAEDKGILCRDETVELGVTWWLNFIVKDEWSEF